MLLWAWVSQVALIGAGLVVFSRRRRSAASSPDREKQLADVQIDRRLRGRSQLENELKECQSGFDQRSPWDQPARLCPSAQSELAQEEAHVARIDELTARLERLVGRDAVGAFPASPGPGPDRRGQPHRRPVPACRGPGRNLLAPGWDQSCRIGGRPRGCPPGRRCRPGMVEAPTPSTPRRPPARRSAWPSGRPSWRTSATGQGPRGGPPWDRAGRGGDHRPDDPLR